MPTKMHQCDNTETNTRTRICFGYIKMHWLSSLALDDERGSWKLAAAAAAASLLWLLLLLLFICCWLYKFLKPLTWCALSWFFSTGNDCLLCWWSSITNWLNNSGARACLSNSLKTQSMLRASLAEHLTKELPWINNENNGLEIWVDRVKVVKIWGFFHENRDNNPEIVLKTYPFVAY